MRFPRRCEVDRLVSKDEDRPSLHHPFLRGECLYASNGHAFVRVDVVRTEEDEGGYIPWTGDLGL